MLCKYLCWANGLNGDYLFVCLVPAVVFWGGPLLVLYDTMRSNMCSVHIKLLHPATAAELERMGGNCAICWAEMTTEEESGPEARPLTDVDDDSSEDSSSESSDGSDESTSEVGENGVIAGAGEVRGAQGAAGEGAAGAGAPEMIAAAVGGGGGGGRAPAAAAAAGGGVEEAQAEAAAAAALPAHAAAAEHPAWMSELSSQPAMPTKGHALPCGHAFHHACLTQWLQQCHAQGVPATCPMCQRLIQLEVKWHVPVPWGRKGRGAGPGGAAAAAVARAPVQPPSNNYLLAHQPQLAEMLQDMPQILAPEHLALVQEVEDLQQQRHALLEELQLQRQQLRDIQGRHQVLQQEEMEMEQQRGELLRELQLLRRAARRRRQQRERQRQRQPQQQVAAGNGGGLGQEQRAEGAAAAEGAAPGGGVGAEGGEGEQQQGVEGAGRQGWEEGNDDAEEAEVRQGEGLEMEGDAELEAMLEAFLDQRDRERAQALEGERQ